MQNTNSVQRKGNESPGDRITHKTLDFLVQIWQERGKWANDVHEYHSLIALIVIMVGCLVRYLTMQPQNVLHWGGPSSSEKENSKDQNQLLAPRANGPTEYALYTAQVATGTNQRHACALHVNVRGKWSSHSHLLPLFFGASSSMTSTWKIKLLR